MDELLLMKFKDAKNLNLPKYCVQDLILLIQINNTAIFEYELQDIASLSIKERYKRDSSSSMS